MREPPGVQGQWLSVQMLPPHQPLCLSSPLPHCPNPSSGYVQAAGLKSDPGGRRPFLLIRNQEPLPNPSAPDQTPFSPRLPVLGPPLAPCHQGWATLHLGSPVTKGNMHGLPERSQTIHKSLQKRLFPARAGRRGAWELCHVQEWFIQNCLGTDSMPGPVLGPVMSLPQHLPLELSIQ